MKNRLSLALIFLLPLLFYFLIPFSWLPIPVKTTHYKWFGIPSYVKAPESKKIEPFDIEDKCPRDFKEWRKEQLIEGIKVQRSEACLVDNPHLIAAVVKGTNNVSHMTLMESKLTPDAVTKGEDLDNDGDPDVIHIRLEVAELNGSSPDSEEDITTFNIAPGINPGMWVFVPKTFGMSTENFESLKANRLLRSPSPVIRIEQGDQVKITLENSHYMPHTIHFHGVDHPFVDENGEGNDGVPQTSEVPLMPGKSRTYEMSPRQAGTMFYHCHVQPQVHIMMGLQGMFVIEENKPNNWVQTLNIGAGHVRYPSQASKESYDSEYDLHYQAIDKDLNNLIKVSNDARETTKAMHRDHNITQARNDYFTVNGKSFPYTAQESIIVTEPNQKLKLRILNGSDEGVALHTHGHKFTSTHLDGVQVPPAAQITRDVAWIAPAQRADIKLETTNDGLHSYGEGIWLMHDHVEKSITNDGIAPGGSATAIVYKKYLGEGGFPLAQGVSWNKFFVADYYKKSIPVWAGYDEQGTFAEISKSNTFPLRLILLITVAILWLFSFTQVIRK